mmetsp:Transcript_532/g.1461  ORF Transcript_532/g.1461 Transcript_532/m.1461 type:complete len:371 (-) Transcript_532:441-1553(-)
MFNSLFSSNLEKPLLEDEEPGPRRIPLSERMKTYLEASAESTEATNPTTAKVLRTLSPVMNVIVLCVVAIAPIYMWIYKQTYLILKKTPTNMLQMIFGVALCFFGGTFTASIAAIEGFRQMGFKQTLADIHDVMEQVHRVKLASDKDDRLDDDHDGIADVDEIPPAELAKRKMKLAMVTVEDPAKLSRALSSLWAAYLAVLATLKLQFAQTTAIALGIVEVVQFPITRALAPFLAQALGPDLKHWVETVLDTAVKLVAIIFAWNLQMIISAFYSGIRGGRMFALALCEVIHERGWGQHVERLPGVAKPFHPDTSFLDELVGYTLGAIGFTWQLYTGFTLFFPLNLALLPLEIVEWLLRFQITFAAPTTLA